MKIKRYLFSLLLILVLFGNNVNATNYVWSWLNSGPNYSSPDELCGDSGGTPSYPITGPGGWYGCWGVCYGSSRGPCFVRWGDSCPAGTQYNSDLGSCENTDKQVPAPGVAGEPQSDECPNGRNDNTGHCNPESGADMCESVGNPILISTGQKVEFEEDLSINGSILSFKRNYWSSRRNVSNVGLGWQFNWRMYIQQLTYKNQVKLYRDDGTGYIFTPKENGAWEGTVGTNLSLTSLPNNNGWKVITANGNVETYNNQGQLISYSKNGYPAINFTYNAIGQLITLLEDNTARILTLTYNTKGLITKVTSNTGLSVTFSYDTQNRLVSRVKNAKTKKYHYENTQFPNALTGITDERNIRYVTWMYNDKGQAISSENIGGTNKYQLDFLDSNRTQVTNPLGKQTIYHFGNFLNKRKITKVEGIAINSCVASNSTYHYDYKGLLISKTDENGATTSYKYNDRGFEIERNLVGSGLNYIVYTKWHDTLPLPVEINHNGQRKTYQYDNNGWLVKYSDGTQGADITDPLYDSTLLQFNDFTDPANNLWITHNNPQIVAASEAIGGNGLHLDGNSYLTTDSSNIMNFGTGEFTIEFWVKPIDRQNKDATPYTVLTTLLTNTINNVSFNITIGDPTSSDIVACQYYLGSSSNRVVITRDKSFNLYDGNWHHIAIVREKTKNPVIYIDGKNTNATAYNGSWVSLNTVSFVGTMIGGRYDRETARFYGYLDQVRVIKKAIYSEDFTPSKEPYAYEATE